MKILIISQYFYPENFRVNDLAIELKKRGNDVDVLTGFPQYPYGKIYDGYGFKIPYEKEWNGINIHRVKMMPRGKTPIGMLLNCCTFVREANKWVKKCNIKYDAVYVYEVSPVTVGLPAVTYKQKFGTPIYFNVQDLWPESVEHVLGIKNRLLINYLEKIVMKIYNNSDKILCSSKAFVGEIEKRGINKDKLVYWPQFSDQMKFENSSRPNVLDTNHFNIVYAGNIGRAQGLDLLIKSIDDFKETNVRCYLVGDGRERQSLEKMVKDLNLIDYVHFIGRVSPSEAEKYIHFSDLAYLSLIDNHVMDMTVPAKLQTYMAAGAVILGAVNGECREIISESKCGIAVNKNEVDVTKAIKYIMEMQTAMKEEMSQNSVSYHNNNFRTKIIIDNLLDIMSNNN